MQEASDAACSRPNDEIMSTLVRSTKLTERQIREWYKTANAVGWPFGISALLPNIQGNFATGKVFEPDTSTSTLLTEWVLENAGVCVQHFNGDGLNQSNSSVRYVEFVNFFTTFEASGAEYQTDVENELVSSAMEEISRGASRLLSGLRSDGKALSVCRCFVNVMDMNNISGAGPHVDFEASMGTVVVKLTGEDTTQEALHIHDPDCDKTTTPLQMPKGHGVAFLPMILHSVPSRKRTTTRVTINLFFQSGKRTTKNP